MAGRGSSFHRVPPRLVKEIEITANHPGYKYIYFESYQELNDYFLKECGPDWMSQPWAKYWFGSHWRFQKQEYANRYGKPPRVYKKKYKTKNKTDRVAKEILLQLIQHYRSEGVITSRAISDLLKSEHDISVHFTYVAKMIKEHKL